MKRQWIFVTNNSHKLQEAQDILSGFAQIVSLNDIGFYDEIAETASDFKGNALLKAQAVFEKTGLPCFADDSGLCVTSLNFQPGVKSARYSSETGHTNHQANNEKLLIELAPKSDRSAFFITVICAIGFQSEPIFFEGKVNGKIGLQLKGSDGFGYDPLFIPEGYHQTFAELGSSVKNSLSHRSIALNAMKDFLLSLENNQ